MKKEGSGEGERGWRGAAVARKEERDMQDTSALSAVIAGVHVALLAHEFEAHMIFPRNLRGASRTF